MYMCVVVNKYKSQYDVYIGRGSIWGNPFVMSNESQRAEVIAKYKKHLWNQIQSGEITKQDLIALNGKRLGCFCAPKPCHGDVIKDAVNWALSN